MAMFEGDPSAYQPPISLWRLVEQNVSPSEQDELKNMLGESLIDTTQELHEEVNMLLEIWRDYNDETETENQHRQKLAEPPHVRDRLIQEISFLAENIREKSLRNGMNPSAVLSKHKAQVIEYAEESKRSSMAFSRPMSARSADGRQTPLSPTEQASSRAALSTSIAEDVTSSSSKFNYMEFDDVCNRLRDTLTQEMEQLKMDVNFLQSCLDNAADSRSRGVSPAFSREPTLTELREERTLLEKELLFTETLPKTPLVNKPAFQPSNIRNLGPVTSGKLRPVHVGPPTAQETTSKTKPLKASHHIAYTTTTPDSTTSGASTPDSGASREREVMTPEFEEIRNGVVGLDVGGGEGLGLGGGDGPDAGRVTDVAPDEGRMSQASHATNRAVTMQNYDFDLPVSSNRSRANPGRSSPGKSSSGTSSRSTVSPQSSSGTSCHRSPHEKDSSTSLNKNRSHFSDDSIRRRDAYGAQRRRNVSPARVKVVPVSSILDPQSESPQPFMPTPPPGDTPRLTRPGSAERFRKMVLQYREST